MTITCSKILSDFLSYRYPFWGACRIQILLRPFRNVMYLDCPIPGRREAILEDINELRLLDIGIQTFVICCGEDAAVVVESPYPKVC